MTFDDDLLLFVLPSGDKRIPVLQLGLQWPPPATIRLRGFEPPFADIDFRLLSMSQLTDVERANRTDLCRVARYVHAMKGLQ